MRRVKVEFGLGDRRLDRRARLCVERLEEHPWESFTQTFQKSSELEGFYRLLHNERSSETSIVASVRRASFCMAKELSEALVVHDTTTINPVSKSLEDFSRLRGFWAHVSLLVSPVGDEYELLGPVGLSLTIEGKGQTGRWQSQVQGVERARDVEAEHLKLIHVMDSEADSSDIWSSLVNEKQRFVIRVSRNRKVADQHEHMTRLFDEIAKAKVIGTRKVRVTKRTSSQMPHSAMRHSARKGREVELKISSAKLKLQLTRKNPSGNSVPSGESMEMNVVRAFEHRKATTGANAVDWILLTSESIDTVSDVERVIDIYRRRWVIEEYFKVLKTGCRIEGRLLADKQSWFNLTALLMPVAAHVLRLKMSVEKDRALKHYGFSQTQLSILKLKAKEHGLSFKTISDAERVIGKIGGHLKYRGPPGWITLLRGWLKLEAMEEGFDLARRTM